MKNIFKLTLLSACFVFSTTMIAQQAKKAPAKKQTTHQKGKATPKSKTAAAPAPAATKTEAAKTDGGPVGGTRMAITEQGVPKRSKNSAANSKVAPAANTGTSTSTTDPAKK